MMFFESIIKYFNKEYDVVRVYKIKYFNKEHDVQV